MVVKDVNTFDLSIRLTAATTTYFKLFLCNKNEKVPNGEFGLIDNLYNGIMEYGRECYSFVSILSNILYKFKMFLFSI